MEHVLVVNREQLEQTLPRCPFITDEENIRKGLDFILANYTFEDRGKAEYDTSLKQIIPYVVIRQANRFYMLKRLKKQMETRLHNMLSLGVGGHINPGESMDGSILKAGLYRELREEVFVEEVHRLTSIGILNENTQEVSNFHTGIVFLLEVSGEVRVLETEKMEGQWVSMDTLTQLYEFFESWSQIIIQFLQKKPEFLQNR